MNKLREFPYKINGLSLVSDDVIKTLEDNFSGVKGVIGISIDKDNDFIKYVLDEWSSEYDVFCKLNEICESLDLKLDFGEEIKEVTPEKTDEIQIESEEENQEDEQETDNPPVKGKLEKFDFIEKAVVYGLSLVVTLVGFFLSKYPNIQPWLMMLGFTLASYETLYSVIVKIAEKDYVLEEVITFCGALALMYLGYTLSAFAVMFTFGLLAFVQSIVTHKNVVALEKLNEQLNNSEDENEKNYILKKLEFLNSNSTVCDLKTAKLLVNRLKYNLYGLGFALILTFIPPLFNIKSYGIELTNKWLYVGAFTMVVTCFGNLLFSLILTAKTSVSKCISEDVFVNDYNEYVAFADVESVCFDKDVLKADDSFGAVTEIKEDLNLSVNIVSSGSGEEVTTLKNDLNANGGLANASEESKIKYAKKKNAVLISNNLYESDEIRQITYAEKGNVSINSTELKKVPFVLKMARRTAKTQKRNITLSILEKVVLIALCIITKTVLFVDGIWWILLVGFIFEILMIIASLYNSTDPV